MQNDLGAIVEEDAVRAVGEHIAQPVLRAEIDKLDHELGTWLALTLLD